MTIMQIHDGDITASSNPHDIIIGMNTRLAEASAIGRKVLIGKKVSREIELGSVVTFQFDRGRQLHMVVCHHLAKGGWTLADRYIRFGLDYLWQRSPAAQFSIVQIGDGKIGRRDGADVGAIMTAMASSYASLHLYIWKSEPRRVAEVQVLPLRPIRTWSMERGERVAA